MFYLHARTGGEVGNGPDCLVCKCSKESKDLISPDPKCRDRFSKHVGSSSPSYQSSLSAETKVKILVVRM